MRKFVQQHNVVSERELVDFLDFFFVHAGQHLGDVIHQ
jgi:hypothetical protein